jgi:tetratricopeptide (TPR) repeat protein
LEAIDLDSKCVKAYIWAGFLYSQLEQFEEAIKTLSTAKAIDPLSFEVAKFLAAAYTKCGRVDEAQACWEDASALDHTKIFPWVNQAKFHEERDNFLEAKRCYERAKDADVFFVLPWETLLMSGNAALTSGRLSEAKVQFEKASAFDRAWKMPCLGIGICELREKNFAKALEQFRRVLALDGTDVECHLLAAEAASNLNEEEIALEHWKRAFELDPSAKVPWVIEKDKAQDALAEGKLALAIELLERSIQLYGSWIQSKDLLQVAENRLRANGFEMSGDKEAARGNFERAEALWNEALICYELPTAHMKLGAEYADRGETAAALSHFQSARDLGHPLAEKAFMLCRSYHNFDPDIGPVELV